MVKNADQPVQGSITPKQLSTHMHVKGATAPGKRKILDQLLKQALDAKKGA